MLIAGPLVFDPKPTFPHLSPESAERAVEQFHLFQEQMATTAEDLLHCALQRRSNLREHSIFLLSKYLKKQHATVSDLRSATGAVDIDIEGLLTPRHDGTVAVDLTKLDARALYALYTAVPSIRRSVSGKARPKLSPSASFASRLDTGPSGVRKKKKKRDPTPGEARPTLGGKMPTTAFHTASWVQCNDCNKWRRIFANPNSLPDVWRCRMHPAASITCDHPEDEMDADEKWL